MTTDTDTYVQAQHRLLIEQMPLGVLSIDLQGNILEMNPALRSLLGLSSVADVHGFNVRTFPPLLQVEISNSMQHCLELADVIVTEHSYVSEQGKSAHLRLNFAPVRDDQGHTSLVQVVFEDVSEYKQVEKLSWEYQRRLEDQNAELNKLSQAIEQSANIVVITDLKGNIEYVNPKFVVITGYSAEEVLGQNTRILSSGEQGKAYYKELWETITSGRQWQGEFHNRCKDGTLYWEQASIAPVFDPAGRMTHFIATKEVITERKQAEEALQRSTERLKTLHEIDQSVLAAQLPETIAVAAIHRLRRLIPCQRIMVMAREESGEIHMLAAASDGEVDSVADLNIYQGMFEDHPLGRGFVEGCEDLAALPELSIVQRFLYNTGMRSYVTVPLFIQGALVGTLNLESSQPQAFTTDHIAIAVEVAASLAVAIRQAHLYEKAQQQIAERMRAERVLRRYTVELEARNAELDAFAHTVAHDLKTPVSSIVGYADVIRRNYMTLTSDSLDQFLEVIARNARKIASIIDELLLLASVRDKEEIELHPLEMGRIVVEARGRLLYLIEEYQGEIKLPESWPVALGYGPWIEAVWTNYISNALKYGGRPPRVELGATIQEGAWVRFWVRDNGPALSAEQQAHLFTPFERLHQARAQGHGLGLSIVQRIVKKLGGQVGVESAGQGAMPEQGSIFYFTLPAVSTVEA